MDMCIDHWTNDSSEQESCSEILYYTLLCGDYYEILVFSFWAINSKWAGLT